MASISRLPGPEEKSRTKKTFKSYPLGYFYVDIAEVRTEEGKLCLFVAIDRTSKVATPNCSRGRRRCSQLSFYAISLRPCPTNHTQCLPTKAFSLTKPSYPWTNGQVERMNRTLTDANVKRYHYETHQHFKEHPHAYWMAYNFAKRLQTLKGLTPYEFVCASCQKEPHHFRLDPHHHSVGPYS